MAASPESPAIPEAPVPRDATEEGADEDAVAEIARDLVEGHLRFSVNRTDLAPTDFIAAAVEARAEVAKELAPEWAMVVALERDLRWAERRHRAQLISLAVVSLSMVLALMASIGPLPLWLAYIPLAASLLYTLPPVRRRYEGSPPRDLPGSTNTAPRDLSIAALKSQLEDSRRHYGELLAREVEEWLSAKVDLEIGEIFEPKLPELDPRGLAEVETSKHEISTKTDERLGTLLKQMPGGSIGISGPRGVGKTTLLKRATADAKALEPDRVSFGIGVDAPVDYDARDFVLHLFARLCEEVLGSRRVSQLRHWDRPIQRSLQTFRSLRSVLFPSAGPLLLIAGAVLYLAITDTMVSIDPARLKTPALAMMGVGTLLTLSTLQLNPAWTMEFFRGLLPFRRREGDASEIAERRLRQIWFQRTFSNGWSGTLKGPIGLQAGIERNTQLAENQLTYPEVVDLFKKFVRQLAAEGQVRIGIDELDKMDDQRAHRFLNEIKVIFRISGCFYLVSVSEDAMSQFERRGLPIRDVFDSSFDEVMPVDYFSYPDSHRLIRRRVVGMPVQFVALCHVMSGGLARDVIRVARDVCEQEAEMTIEDVSMILCTRQLFAKCRAAGVAVRRLADPGHVSALHEWLRGIEIDAAQDADLISRCARFNSEFKAAISAPSKGDQRALDEYREALSIAFEITCFAYFIVTVRQTLSDLVDEEKAKAAIAGPIDRLGEAKQGFAVNPGQAWEVVSFVRETSGRDRVAAPSLHIS
jgi:hypothetical protein